MGTWKDIPNYRGYQASDNGNLRSLDYKRTGMPVILKPAKTKDGYLKTMIKRDDGKYTSKTVHFFIMLAFRGERPSDKTVNHIDGNKENNAIENLEYVTLSQNVRHAFDNGLNRESQIKDIVTRRRNIWPHV